MKYYNLTLKAYLKKDIPFGETFDSVTKYINFSMTFDEELKKFHAMKGFKFYVFSGFYPVEKDKIYKKGNIYSFTLNSVYEIFIDKMADYLKQNTKNSDFIVVETDKRAIKKFFITEIYTLTPVIVSVAPDIYWTFKQDGDIIKLLRLLHENLIKKHNTFFYNDKLNPELNFIQSIQIKNRVPQTIKINKTGKNFKFFGNKFKIIPNEDDTSQKLAFLSLSAGLGEKNSYGAGFCVGRG